MSITSDAHEGDAPDVFLFREGDFEVLPTKA
jgi:hypothetical protein